MDIVNLIISLVSGIAGGNAAGAAMPDKSLGTIGNSIAGLFGGGVGGFLMQVLGVLHSGGAAGLDITSVLSNVASSGVGGAILVTVIGLIKNAMNKT